GVVFDAGNPEQAEEGGRVYEVRTLAAVTKQGRARRARDSVLECASPLALSNPALIPKNQQSTGAVKDPPLSSTKASAIVELHFGRGDINFRRVHVGDKLWKTSDP